MGLKRQQSTKDKRSGAKGTTQIPAPKNSEAVAISANRRWLFRLLAAVLLPVLLLGAVEIGLRLADYGYPTSFFIKRRIQGKNMLVENTWFGRRFFPPSLIRSPSPVVMAAEKPTNVFRIFLFGESAALGDPRPAYGAGRYLETLLRERFPGTEFEVVSVAMTAINSHAILPIARECARYEGDLWIIYMGNNEYVGPFGASTVFGPAVPSLSLVRASLWAQQFRVGQWISALTQRLGKNQTSPAHWSGLRIFLQHELSPGDERRARVREHFQRNLMDILNHGRRAGVPILLSRVASNLKDCAPFASRHTPELTGQSLTNWQQLHRTSSTLVREQRWVEAELVGQQTVQLSPQHAEAHFILGQCLQSLNLLPAAVTNYTLARDFDALPFRTDSSLNAVIASAARQYAGRGVHYVDTEQALAQQSPDQIPGQELFYEHVHFNFDGNYWLAVTWAEQIKSLLPARITQHQNPEWTEPETCAQRLGLTDWNRYSVLESMVQRLFDAPYTNQFNHEQRLEQQVKGLIEVKERLHPRAIMDTRAIYEEALQKHPRDYWLRQNYAEFLEATGEFAQAVTQWQQVRDLLPHHHAAYFQLGRLLARQNQYPQAEQAFQEALRRRPDLAEAYLELGQMYAQQGQGKEALIQYDQAQHYQPDDARVYFRKANVFMAQKIYPEAVQNLREAVRLRPKYWEAHYLLGVALAAQEKYSAAQTEFQAVIQLKPDYVSAHFNLAVALAKQHRYPEAIAQFQETLRRDPNHRQAQQYLTALTSLPSKQP